MGGLSKRADKRASTHLHFTEVAPNPDSQKTKLWAVGAGGFGLGKVSWKAQWRRYWFEPFPQTGFDALCMEQIASFCREETRKHDEECRARRSKNSD